MTNIALVQPCCGHVADAATQTTSIAPIQPLVTAAPTLMSGAVFTRLGGLSGAMAVAVGAYGAHRMAAEEEDIRRAFETANKHHLIHR